MRCRGGEEPREAQLLQEWDGHVKIKSESTTDTDPAIQRRVGHHQVTGMPCDKCFEKKKNSLQNQGSSHRNCAAVISGIVKTESF